MDFRKFVYTASLYFRWIIKLYDLITNLICGRKSMSSILMYHSVGGNEKIELDIPNKVFEKQILRLITIGQVIPLERYLSLKLNKTKKRFFVLTFDDGFDNFYTNVFPILKKYNITATLFPAIDFLNHAENNPLHKRVGAFNKFKPVKLIEIKEMVDSGLVSLASHGYSHIDYSKENDLLLDEDIKRANEWFRYHFHFIPQIFAYPMGRFSYNSHRIIQKHFKIAFLAGHSADNNNNINLLKFPRIPILRTDKIFWFNFKIKGLIFREQFIIQKIVWFLRL